MVRPDPVFPALEQGVVLNETLRSLIREELLLAESDEPRPENAEDRMTETGKKVEEAAREIARFFEQAPSSAPGGSGYNDRALLLLGEFRRTVEDTMEMISEASRTIRETRDSVHEELIRAGGQHAAVRAYTNSQTLLPSRQYHEN
jgi:hypothetical protein